MTPENQPQAAADERPETDRIIADRARGPAERAVLGGNPYGSVLRIVFGVLAFVVIAGTLFYFLLGRG